MEEANFNCLRCGNTFKDHFDKTKIVERACPKCGSNSVRRDKKSKASDAHSPSS